MAELRWSKLALNDLEEIIIYIAEDSEDNAKLFVASMIDSIETMSAFPYSGRIVPELKNEKIREKIFNKYRIIYRINSEIMEVVRVLHNAREFTDLD
jgi:toxin ParE1/3/4